MPRKLVESGIPGLGQERFPETALELGRRQGLFGSAVIHRYTEEIDGGGATNGDYVPDDDPVDARLDWYQTSANKVTADKIDETARHVISFRDGQTITTNDQVEIEGKMWSVMALREWTRELITQVEVLETVT